MATTVNKEKVNQSGIDLIDDVTKMYNSLTTIKGYIDNSKSYFDSDAGDALRKKFNTSAAKFEEFRTFLNSYGEFLKTFSGNITSFETAVEDAASQIPDL